MSKNKHWLFYALTTTLFWGIWGAFSETSNNAGFPGTLVYIVWSLTMIIPAVIGLNVIKWKIERDKKSILFGLTIGFLGAGGQYALLTGAFANGPAYLIFPIISLSPVITVLLSLIVLKERASKIGWAGIILAVFAIPWLMYQDPTGKSFGYLWLIFALIVFFVWGFQAFVIKLANNTMKAESIFFYMTITGLLLSPVAWLMTDHSQAINWGFKGPYLAFGIQLLNAIGALTIVYAYRFGKAIIVSPLTNAVAPIITILLSLIINSVFPHPIVLIGMLLAIISIFLLAKE
jgi:drug/metabolite transporter (DMT)-like permease